jgi:hypothetical protein
LLERLKDKTKGIKTIELKDGGKGIWFLKNLKIKNPKEDIKIKVV